MRTYRGHSCADLPAGMVCVTAGSFVMGSRIGDADEMPFVLTIGATFWHFFGALWIYLFAMLSLV